MKINKFTSIAASLMLAGAFTSVSACEIPVDVHPLSCPNPINANANKKGVITGLTPAAILGTEKKDMNNIDLTKDVELFISGPGWLTNGGNPRYDPKYSAVAVKTALEDVAAPVPDGLLDPEAECGENENNCYNSEDGNGPDGYDDLTIKFGTDDVIRAIENAERHRTGNPEFVVSDGELYCVTIMAWMKGAEKPVHGSDTIRINKKKSKIK